MQNLRFWEVRLLFNATQRTLLRMEHIITFTAGPDTADAIVFTEPERAGVPEDTCGEPATARRPRGWIA